LLSIYSRTGGICEWDEDCFFGFGDIETKPVRYEESKPSLAKVAEVSGVGKLNQYRNQFGYYHRVSYPRLLEEN
jgi:hypothetical protein